MFQNWGFLITEIWFLLLLAALLGLLIGWLIWGRRSDSASSTTSAASTQNAASQSTATATPVSQTPKPAPAKPQPPKPAPPKPEPASAKPAPAKPAAAKSAPAKPAAKKAKAAADTKASKGASQAASKAASKSVGKKPESLKAARGGKADDLKLIKGVGPKLEKLCNKLGFYHFDQIAAWKKAEVEWVDENLEGFKGRVSRDEWVKQAKILASGKETEFSKKSKK